MLWQVYSLKLNIMKKLSLLILALIMSFIVMAQEKTKQREVGLVFNSLNSFGLTYKTGNEKSLWRYTTLFMNGTYSEVISDDDSQNANDNNTGMGLKLGKEIRKKINDKLDFRYGADLSFSYRQRYFKSSTREETSKTYIPGLNLVLGLNYVLNNHFIIGAELLPFLDYSIGSRTEKYEVSDGTITNIEKDVKSISYGLDSSSAMLSILYRF